MSNPLTGDFDAVFQVSGSTVNRLLASLHQNAFTNRNLPSFPHTVQIRIGDDRALEGVRGFAQVQVGCPRIELIHGAIDRFVIVVDVRARYWPDTGTNALPEFIHGTVRAEYRIRDIDPSCFGWSKKASTHLWVRVVKDSVQFIGTAQGDVSGISLITTQQPTTATGAENIARIARQIARQLARRFAAAPHPLTSTQIRKGLLRSLNAPIGGSAVAVPLSLDGSDPVGDINSLNNLILDGADFGVAIGAGHINGLLNDIAASIKAYAEPIPAAGTIYDVKVTAATPAWTPQTTDAKITLKVEGSAISRPYISAGPFSISPPDASVMVEQDIILYFDGQHLVLAPTRLVVDVPGLVGYVAGDMIKARVITRVKEMVKDQCTAAQKTLNDMIARTGILRDQLATLDDQAAVHLEQGHFLRDGIILRGRIALSPRKRGEIKFEKTPEGDGYSALASWIPGGRINKFEWSWAWNGTRPPGKATYDDRFVLKRPAGKPSRWGVMTELRMALPGLDGSGSVCLTLKGEHTHAATGALVPVEIKRMCTRFGFQVADTITEGARLYLWDDLGLQETPELSQDVPFPQLAAVRGRHDAAVIPNTLLLFAGRAWNRETAEALERGIERSGRYDATLAVIVLFEEGALREREVVAQVEEIGERVGVALFVNEDVGGSWSRTFSLDAAHGMAWRLISPDGAIAWRQDGSVAAEDLTKALDVNLRRSQNVSPFATFSGPEIGAQVSIDRLGGWFEQADPESPCPPGFPYATLGIQGTVISFVHKGAQASADELRRVFADYGQRGEDGPALVMIVDGADGREAEALKDQLGIDDVSAIADPSGMIAKHFGVDVWPTTLVLSGSGLLADVSTGASRGGRSRHQRDKRSPTSE